MHAVRVGRKQRSACLVEVNQQFERKRQKNSGKLCQIDKKSNYVLWIDTKPKYKYTYF